MDYEFDFDFPENTLRDRLVLLAGGSGGLGSACAVLLAREGARLLLGYQNNGERAAALAEHLRTRYACRVVCVQSDICTSPGRRALLLAAAQMEGPLQALVCLVGSPARVKLSEAGEEDLTDSWRRNYVGPILLARDVAARMRRQETDGSIVLFSTMQALALFNGSTTYSAPKVALLQAVRLMAKENPGPPQIRVNVVAPGVNRAGMALASIESGKYDQFVKNGTIPRFGRAEDVARVVRLLLEPDNYITGQVIAVDGGFTLRV